MILVRSREKQSAAFSSSIASFNLPHITNCKPSGNLLAPTISQLHPNFITQPRTIDIMSGWFTPRNMLYATGILAGVAMVPKLTGPNTYVQNQLGIGPPRNLSSFSNAPSSNIFETPGSKQIGDRWSAGGATNNHTPGAATPRGTYVPSYLPSLPHPQHEPWTHVEAPSPQHPQRNLH